jgi:hypothetical protein
VLAFSSNICHSRCSRLGPSLWRCCVVIACTEIVLRRVAIAVVVVIACAEIILRRVAIAVVVVIACAEIILRRVIVAVVVVVIVVHREKIIF